MKISKNKTTWLAVKASVASEWDSCNFILLELTEALVQLFKQRAALAKTLSTDMSLYSITYWQGPEGWYVFTIDDDGNGITSAIEQLFETEDSFYIEFDNEEELRNLPTPEQRVDVQRIEFQSDRTARFTALGKYTDEEFWTSDFSIDNL